MEFQLSYFKSWKMILWKCCTQYASKFGKLSSVHRLEKVNFHSNPKERQCQRMLKVRWGEVAQSCLTLCDPMDRSLPVSSLHGIPLARVLEWAAISFSRGSSQPRDWTWVSCTAGGFFTTWATREAWVELWVAFFFSSLLQGRQDLSSWTRDWTHALAVEAWNLNHWTAW